MVSQTAAERLPNVQFFLGSGKEKFILSRHFNIKLMGAIQNAKTYPDFLESLCYLTNPFLRRGQKPSVTS
jgi:hypothetical protein